MKNVETFLKVSNIVENEKTVMGESSRRLALCDFTRVAQEYFDLHSPVELYVELKEGKYEVNLRFTADRVRNSYPLK